jgi:GH15 family glucan-1,4-alpha-glucosidase
VNSKQLAWSPRSSAAIQDHGLIGDLRTCALVADDGSVAWYCPGRFDAPSVFASVLDAGRGGTFRVWVEGARSSQLYMPDTAVLVTRFVAADGGIGEVVDFMEPGVTESVVHRILRGVHGTVRFEVACRPRFDYGRAEPVPAEVRDGYAFFDGAPTPVHLLASMPLEADGAGVRARVELSAGQSAALALASVEEVFETPSGEALVDLAEGALAQTLAFWRAWIRRSTYRGRWTEAVHRAAVTLKLLTHAPTGGIVAAATTALPEEPGGERNWDYRYTWVRDGSLSAHALRGIGFHDEAEEFARWIGARIAEGPTPSGEPLAIMYRVDGSTDLVEEELPHLAGHADSRPVRIGNGAADQLQLDVYGEALYSLGDTEYFRSPEGRARIVSVLDWLVDNWDRPDEGIWETRGGRRDFTYSRVMCWAAFDRGAAAAPDHPGVGAWLAARDAIARQVEEHAWDEKQGAYVQSYGSAALDASLLFMPLVGFVRPDHPQWRSTLAAYRTGLTEDGLCHRYRTGDFTDGLAGDESSFDLCTLLYHTVLAISGDPEAARWEFAKFLRHAGPTGLFAEELAPDGAQWGNYPQAFTHLGVIMAAQALDAALDTASGAASGPGRDGGDVTA